MKSALLVAFALMTSIANQGDASRLPANAQGKLAAEYVEVFNTNDDDAMARFFERSASEAANKRRTDAERRASYRRLRDRIGSIRDVEVVAVEDLRLIVRVRTAKGPEPFIVFDFSTSGGRTVIEGMLVEFGPVLPPLPAPGTRPGPVFRMELSSGS